MRITFADIGHAKIIDAFNRYRAAVVIPENIAGADFRPRRPLAVKPEFFCFMVFISRCVVLYICRANGLFLVVPLLPAQEALLTPSQYCCCVYLFHYRQAFQAISAIFQACFHCKQEHCMHGLLCHCNITHGLHPPGIFFCNAPLQHIPHSPTQY